MRDGLHQQVAVGAENRLNDACAEVSRNGTWATARVVSINLVSINVFIIGRFRVELNALVLHHLLSVLQHERGALQVSAKTTSRGGNVRSRVGDSGGDGRVLEGADKIGWWRRLLGSSNMRRIQPCKCIQTQRKRAGRRGEVCAFRRGLKLFLEGQFDIALRVDKDRLQGLRVKHKLWQFELFAQQQRLVKLLGVLGQRSQLERVCVFFGHFRGSIRQEGRGPTQCW
ncbi:hypothetical protein CAOG_009886 [Capsaspora owczarzaki ATCC 30864]|uniref:Uncharacterized protein n=1 Tax=Capsaspora owczarzaki (strain ATCC 30864) TaxID=595528 RepID=A0A0D2WTX0_CAPO3|nr:hypothetical protein CAOG_009886 [Capsaspora owczarzaki ATCC 30864]